MIPLFNLSIYTIYTLNINYSGTWPSHLTDLGRAVQKTFIILKNVREWEVFQASGFFLLTKVTSSEQKKYELTQCFVNLKQHPDSFAFMMKTLIEVSKLMYRFSLGLSHRHQMYGPSQVLACFCFQTFVPNPFSNICPRAWPQLQDNCGQPFNLIRCIIPAELLKGVVSSDILATAVGHIGGRPTQHGLFTNHNQSQTRTSKPDLLIIDSQFAEP